MDSISSEEYAEDNQEHLHDEDNPIRSAANQINQTTLNQAESINPMMNATEAQQTILDSLSAIVAGFQSLNSKVDGLVTRVESVEISSNTTSNTAFNAALPRTPVNNVTTRNQRGMSRPSLSHLPENTPSATKTLISEYVIPDKQILRGEPNLELIAWLHDTYDHYKNTSADKSKSLIMFIDKKIVLKMLANERKWKTTMGRLLNESTVFRCNDEETSEMLCNLVRPLSRNDFNDKFVAAVRKPDLSSIATLDVAIWHDKIHDKVNTMLADVVKYDDYLRKFATPEDIEMFPKHCWGRSKGRDEGQFRCIMRMFEPHDDEVINLIGEDKLRAMKKLDDLVTALQNWNDEMARESLKLMRKNEALQKPINTADLVKTSKAQRKARTMQDKLRKGVEEKRNHKGYPRLNLLGETLANDEDHEYVANFCALIGAGYSGDPKRQRNQGTGPGHQLPDGAKKLPCYTHAISGNCQAGATCIFSHEHKDAQAFLERELRKVLFSPNFTDVIMSNAKAKGKIEPRIKSDKSSPLKKPSNNHVRGDNKQLDGQTAPSPITDEKSNPANIDQGYDSTTTTMSDSPNGASLSEDEGYATGDSGDN